MQRPAIIFQRVINKGQKPRKKYDEKKKEEVISWVGERVVEWEMCLVGSANIGYSPYIHTTLEYVMSKCTADCIPIRLVGFDSLPENYNPGWKNLLRQIAQKIQPEIDKNKELVKLRAQVKDLEVQKEKKGAAAANV